MLSMFTNNALNALKVRLRWAGRLALALAMIVVLLLAAALSGCGSPPTGERAQPPGAEEIFDTYVIADSTGDWGFPSPFGHYQRGPGYIRMSILFDTLVWKDAAGFVPALARSWEYDPAETAYVFELRDDVTWHDGQPFTAADVVFTFEYLEKHPYGFADTTMVEAVSAADNRVTIKLARPYAPFLDAVAGTVPILPAHIWRDVANPEEFRAPEALVGTGPFVFGDYNKELGTYLYLANPDYYGGRVLVRELKFARVTEEMTPAALQNGQVHAGSVPPETVAALEASGFTIIASPFYWNAKLMINHRDGPLADKKVRQALAYAIDREEITAVAQRGHALAGSVGFIPPDSRWFAPEAHQYPHDPERTAALLVEAGYQRGADGFWARDGERLAFELLFSSGFARDAELIAQQLKAAGIAVNLTSLEAKAVDDRVLNWNFELAVSGHGGLGGDPMQFNRAVIGAGFNSARYEANQELVDVMRRQVATLDEDARLQLVRRAQELYAHDLPALTLYYPKWYWAHDGRVGLFYTAGGVALGVPVPVNKAAFVVD